MAEYENSGLWTQARNTLGTPGSNFGKINKSYGDFNTKWEQYLKKGLTPTQEAAYGSELSAMNQSAANAPEGAFRTLGDSVKEVAGVSPSSNISETVGGLSSLMGVAAGINDILTSRKALKSAQNQLNIENQRKDEIMARDREKYNTYKADKSRLNAAYGGK